MITAGVDTADVAILLGWALAGVAIAVRRFEWLPSAEHDGRRFA